MEIPTTTITTPRCLVCGKSSTMTLPTDRVREWQGGTLIQRAFPEMTPADRELLMSGTHFDCWDAMFADED